jgi:ligand-binding sensor protein
LYFWKSKFTDITVVDGNMVSFSLLIGQEFIIGWDDDNHNDNNDDDDNDDDDYDDNNKSCPVLN